LTREVSIRQATRWRMGESCLESFQDAQDCLPLTLADAADRDLFELGPDLLDLGARARLAAVGSIRNARLILIGDCFVLQGLTLCVAPHQARWTVPRPVCR
jgi:hypothetical protein